MISKLFHQKQLAFAVASALTLVACGTEEAPNTNNEVTPRPLVFSQKSLDLNFTTDDLGSQSVEVTPDSVVSYNGEDPLTLSLIPESFGEAGNGILFNQYHKFQFSTAEHVMVPNPDACPGDEDALIAEPVRNNVISAIVQGGKGGKGERASIKQGETLLIEYRIPQNRYGISYDASLTYAGETHDFSVTTPAATDTVPDGIERLNGFATNPETVSDGKVFTSTVGDETTLTVTAITDNQTIRFRPARVVTAEDGSTSIQLAPVSGMNPFVKSGFKFTTDGKTYLTEELAEEQPADAAEPVMVEVANPVAQVAVYGQENLTTPLAYNACAKSDDYLVVEFNVPEFSFQEDGSGEEYKATLVWNYEELVDSVAVPKSHTYHFVIPTQAKDETVDPIISTDFPDGHVFIGVAPSSPANQNALFYTDVPLSGFNTPVELKVTGNAWYSIDGQPFSNEPTEILPGQNLTLKLIPSHKYLDTVNAGVIIGDQSLSWTVKTTFNPASPVVTGTIEYPPRSSATSAQTVTLRGTAEVSTGIAITKENITINGTVVDSYDPNTKTWRYTATLSTDEDLIFTLGTIAPDDVTPQEEIVGGVAYMPSISIRKLPALDTLFPQGIRDYGFGGVARDDKLNELVDVAVDSRGQTPKFYVAEEARQVSLHTLAADSASQAEPVMLFEDARNDNDVSVDTVNNPSNEVLSVGVNNYRSLEETDYLITGQRLKMVQAHQNTANAPLKRDDGGKLQGAGNSEDDNRQFVFSETGDRIFVPTNAGLVQHYLDYLNKDTSNGKIIDAGNVSTKRVLVSTQDITKSAQSVDIYATGSVEGGDLKEYIFVLDDSGKLAVIKTTGDNSYDTATSAVEFTLQKDNGTGTLTDFTLSNAHSITIDDETATAYVVHDSNSIYSFDVSNVEALLAGSASVEVTELVTPTGAMSYGKLVSIVMAPNMPYMVALDDAQNALFAVDLQTGERVYLFNAAD